jgi:hypothetical protein
MVRREHRGEVCGQAVEPLQLHRDRHEDRPELLEEDVVRKPFSLSAAKDPHGVGRHRGGSGLRLAGRGTARRPLPHRAPGRQQALVQGGERALDGRGVALRGEKLLREPVDRRGERTVAGPERRSEEAS